MVPVLVGAEPSAAAAGGGAIVTAAGDGLGGARGGSAWRCVFEADGGRRADFPASLLIPPSQSDASAITCPAGPWPYPASPASLSIYFAADPASASPSPPSTGGGGGGDGSGWTLLAQQAFVWWEEVWFARPLAWAAGIAATVTVTGAGFDPAARGGYACRFGGAAGEPPQPSTRSPPVWPDNASTLRCPPLVWNATAAAASFSVLRLPPDADAGGGGGSGGEERVLAVRGNSTLRATFEERWDGLAPEAISAARGGVLEVRGGGFREAAVAGGGYSLELVQISADGGAGATLETLLLGFAEANLLSATLGPWVGRVAQTVLVRLRAADGSLVAGAGAGARLRVYAEALAAVPTAASAAGGERLVLLGEGFDSARTYSCRLLGPPPANLSSTAAAPCTRLNFSAVACPAPPWSFPLAPDHLLLLATPPATPAAGEFLARLTFRVLPAVLSGPSPSRAPAASGAALTVSGAGFRAVYPTSDEAQRAGGLGGLLCGFSADPSRAGTRLAEASSPARAGAGASAANASVLVCPTPAPWPGEAGPVFLGIYDPSPDDARDPAAAVLPPRAARERPAVRIDAELLSIAAGSCASAGCNRTVRAMGLRAGRLYRCIIVDPPASEPGGGGRSPPASARGGPPPAPLEVDCAMPVWERGERANVTVELWDEDAGEFAQGFVRMEYAPALFTIRPLSVPATGGANFNITGCCFFAAKAYRAIFIPATAAATVNPLALDPLAAMSVAASAAAELTWLGERWLAGQTPDWALVAQTARVLVMELGDAGGAWGSVGRVVNREDALYLSFTEVVFSLSPTSGLPFGASLQLAGRAFNPTTGDYTCRLSSPGGASALSEQSRPCRAAATTSAGAGSVLLVCPLPRWRGVAARVRVQVLRGEAVLVEEGAAATGLWYQVLAGWAYVKPVTPALLEFQYQGGWPLTVIGAGFDPNRRPGYACRFRALTADGTEDTASSEDQSLPKALRGPNPALDFETLVCYAPAWLYQTTRVTLTVFDVGNASVVPPALGGAGAAFAIGGSPAIHLGAGNGPARGGGPGAGGGPGGRTLSIAGGGFGVVDLSPRASVLPSTCEATVWTSSSTVSCRRPWFSGGDPGFHDVVVSVAPTRLAQRNASFTYDGPKLHALCCPFAICDGGVASACSASRNMAVGGGGQLAAGLALSGADIGPFDLSARTRFGGTAAVASAWSSDTSLHASPAAAAAGGASGGTAAPLVLTVDYALAAATLAGALSFDAPRPVGVANTAGSGGEPTTVTGHSFGGVAASFPSRLGGTAAARTIWASDTTLVVRPASGGGASAVAVLTAGFASLGSASQVVSFDRPPPRTGFAGVRSNAPATGAVRLMLADDGLGVAASGGSLAVRRGGSACEVTAWHSLTSVSIRSPRGLAAASLRLALTAGVGLVGTVSAALSHDVPALFVASVSADQGLLGEGWPFSTEGRGLRTRWVCVDRDVGVKGSGGLDRCANFTDWVPLDCPGCEGGPSDWISCPEVEAAAVAAGVAPADTPCALLPESVRTSPSSVGQRKGVYSSTGGPLAEQDPDVQGTWLVFRPRGRDTPSLAARALAQQAMQGNFLLTALVVSFAEGWVGVGARYGGEGDHLRFEMSSRFGGAARLRRTAGGRTLALYDSAGPAGAGRVGGFRIGTYYLVRVRASGPELSAFVDETAPDRWEQDRFAPHQLWTPSLRLVEDPQVVSKASVATAEAAAAAAAGNASYTVEETLTFGLWTAGTARAYFLYVSLQRGPTQASFQSNLLPPSSTMITLHGSALGISAGASPAVRAHGTAAEATVWRSDTSAAARPPPPAVGPHGSMRAALTVGAGGRAGSITEAVSFDAPAPRVEPQRVQSNLPLAGTGGGPVVAATMSAGLGLDLATSTARVGGTAAEASVWLTATALWARASQGAEWGSVVLAITSGGARGAGSSTEAWSLDGPSLSASAASNGPAGTARAAAPLGAVELSGDRFGRWGYTGGISAGGSAGEQTVWLAESSVRCRSAGASGAASWRAALTVGGRASSVSSALSADLPIISAVVRGGNTAATGSAMVVLLGAGVGSAQSTPVARAGPSAAEVTIWISDSTVWCLVTKAGIRSLRLSVTAGRAARAGTTTQMLSLDGCRVVSGANWAAASGGRVVVLGSGWASAALDSAKVRIGDTTCEATPWVSDSSLICLAAQAAMGGCRRAAVSAGGTVSGSLSVAMSYPSPSTSSAASTNRAASRPSSAVTLFGAGLSLHDRSPQAEVGGTTCEATSWLAVSSLTCISSGVTGSSHRLLMTAGLRIGTHSAGSSFDQPAGISAAAFRSNEAATGGAWLTVAGFGLGFAMGSSQVVSLGGSSCEATEWVSETATLCRMATATLRATRAVVLTAGAVVASVTSAASMDAPWLSGTGLFNAATIWSATVTLVGQSLGLQGSSTAAWTGGSDCEATEWMSDTSAVAKASAVSMRGTGRITLTTGLRMGSLTEEFTYDSVKAISSLNQINGLSAVTLSLEGINFGSSAASMATRGGSSASETTTWTSDTAAVCLVAWGAATVGRSMRMVLTTGRIGGSLSESWTVGGIASSAVSANRAAAAAATLSVTLAGSSLGLKDGSVASRLGTASESTSWKSATMVRARAGRGAGDGATRGITLTAGVLVGSLTGTASMDATGGLSSIRFQNQVIEMGSWAVIAGSALGMLGGTTAARSEPGTACEATAWMSDTAATGLTSTMVGERMSRGMIMTCGLRMGSVSQAASADISLLSHLKLANVPIKSNNVFFSAGLFGHVYTFAVSAGLSLCEMSLWVSDSAVASLLALAVAGRTRGFTLTAGGRVGSLSAALSWDITSLSHSASANQALRLAMASLTVQGAGSGLWGVSANVRSGGTAAESTRWISSSAIIGRLAPWAARGPGSLRVGVTVGGKQGVTATRAVSFDAFDVSSWAFTGGSMPASGGTWAVLAGLGLGLADGSQKGRTGVTATQATRWSSQTSVSCRTSGGLGNSLRVIVSAGKGLAGGVTTTLALTYDAPVPVASVASPWSVTGSWCALEGSTCACNGVGVMTQFNLSSGGTSSAALDANGTIDCSAGSISAVLSTDANSPTACFCFNLPFPRGPLITITGNNFGPTSPSPTSWLLTSGTPAAVTEWVSQTSLRALLPSCTDCLIDSPNVSLAIKIDAADTTFFFTTDVGINISVPYSSFCPQYWLTSGNFTLSSTSSAALLCRRSYKASEDITWTLISCDASTCETSSSVTPTSATTEGTVVRTLPAVLLSFNTFQTSALDSLTISTCTDTSCSVPWVRALGLSGTSLPSSVLGSPYLRVRWQSSAASTSNAWEATWALRSRVFRLFQPTTSLTWTAASAACAALSVDGGGYQLASVGTAGELSAVADILYTSGSDAWIGLNNRSATVWAWSDGSPYMNAYKAWATGYPDASQDASQQCVAASSMLSGQWVTADCSDTKDYICALK